jgi:hypothetical protein
MKRLIFAFLISILGIVASFKFLKPSEIVNRRDEEAIAYVDLMRNEVSRQAEGRLLWSPVQVGEALFPGDKVKTSGLSGAVIRFKGSESKLEVEENSIVVIALNDKKLSLNMLEGRVFLDQKEGARDIAVVSGGKAIDLSGSSAISVSETGESSVQNFSGSLFSDLNPNYSESILSGDNFVNVRWKKESRSENVEAFIGESPALLKKSNASASFNTGELKLKFSPGVNYWQLVSSVNGSEVRSPLMKFVMNKPIPPTGVYPAMDENVKMEKKPFDFKWLKGNLDSSLILQIARDEKFTNLVLSEEVKDRTFYTPQEILPEGKYYWRLRARLNNTSVDSQVLAFTVFPGDRLAPPVPLAPADGMIYYLGNIPSIFIKFDWKRQNEALAYEFKVEGPGMNQELSLAQNSTSFSVGRAGKYKWFVTSESAEGYKSVNPIVRSFEVREVEKLRWLMEKKDFQYLSNLPVLILKWEKARNSRGTLKVGTSPDLREAESFEVSGNDFPYRVRLPGTYFARFSALDDNGQVSGETSLYEFSVTEAPLPPSPQWKNPIVKATPQGDANFEVTNLKPGWLVVVKLQNNANQIVDERRFSESKFNLSGLLPGKFTVISQFRDKYNRLGETSRTTLEVPEKSTIAAPKVKGLNVR